MTTPRKILGLFHLKWLILVQIQLYFNRNVRHFTATTTTVTCIHILLAAEGGGGSIEPVEPPHRTPPRYGPGLIWSCICVSIDTKIDDLG